MLQSNIPTISSACHWDQPQCLEVTLTRLGKLIELRDSKLGSASPVERFTRREWRRFLHRIHEWRPAADGAYRVGDLAFTRAEVGAFIDGADAGEFDTEWFLASAST